MSKRPKTRQTIAEILASCSDTLFPAEMGEAVVHINSTDADGDTPLHVMLWRGDSYGAKCLIAAGADVNAAGDMSETPLHIATRKGKADIIMLLLEKGADPNMKSEFEQTPRSLATEIGPDITRLFTNH